MASSSHATVQPALFGGYGRKVGSYGGIEGVEFAARCPPDVPRNARIVAMCGIPPESAAPQDDGWFVSDFFLFYQMLGSNTELPNQLWFSSFSPRELIRKHGRYLHGPATGIVGERRVVMNDAMLPEDEFTAGFRTIEPKHLLERFVATLRTEIDQAAQNKQPILVLIFAHGEHSTSNFFIGCGEGGPLKLTDKVFAPLLMQNTVQMTLIMTSCYSGGWVFKPNFEKYFDLKPKFNKTFLTAAGPDNESISWPLSQTVGRQAGGSIYATCLLQSMITVTDGTDGFYSEEKSSSSKFGDMPTLVKITENDDGDPIDISMAALIQQVTYECKAKVGSLWDKHNFSFATQDDLWAHAWNERTGIPVSTYKQIWQSLPVAPIKQQTYSDTSSKSGSVVSRSHTEIYNIVRNRAVEYMESYPGLDSSGCNTNCHPGFHRLLRREATEHNELDRLNEILEYRLDLNQQANRYLDLAGIYLPDDQKIGKFDMIEWHETQYKAKRSGSEPAKDLCDRFETIRSWLFHKVNLFELPLPGQGLSYGKPIEYLAMRFSETSLSLPEVYGKLEILCQHKLRLAKTVAESPIGVAILSQPEIKTLRRQLYQSVKRLRHRVRSLSPHKRTPMTEAEFQ